MFTGSFEKTGRGLCRQKVFQMSRVKQLEQAGGKAGAGKTVMREFL
jgi:hypothetical protein